MDYDESEQGPSKSQRKRDAHALQELGEQLVELTPGQLEQLELPEQLYGAVRLAQRIRERGGRKRQILYVGKLLRSLDASAIQQQMAALELQHQEAAARFHRLERWRERLLDEGDSALEEFMQQYPQADRQQLRQLMRNARVERERNAPPKAARALFRCLRDL